MGGAVVTTREGASGAAETPLHTPDEVTAAIRADARFQGYTVASQGPGFVEVDLGSGHLVLVWPEIWHDPPRRAPHLTRARSGYTPLVLLGIDADYAGHAVDRLRDQCELDTELLPLGVVRLAVLLRNHRELCRLRRSAAEGELLTERYQYEIDELNAIGRALSSQRNIDKLMALILEKTRYVTDADAGSVYVVEGEDEDLSQRRLRFKVWQNDSARLDLSEYILPVSSSSIAGRCVLSREVINIPDLYRLDPPGTGNNPWGFKHNRAFDERMGYQTRSVLAVPMIDAADQVIGVIQLINRKRRPEHRLQTPDDFDRLVAPFSTRAQNLAATLASQAAISLENTLLYEDIRQLFEGFVTASITAIEQRDPTTSGHSQRVANLTVALARATEREDAGAYAAWRTTEDELRQIEYAALLHDFGKVGVRESVLVKARKLYDGDRDLILARFDYLRRDLEAEIARRKVALLLARPRDEAAAELRRLDEELEAHRRELDEQVALILHANEPTVLEQEGFERLAELARRTYRDPQGLEQPILRVHEVEALRIPRGSLTEGERREIESHVTHTYEFLNRIPWGRSLRLIPELAGAHHEKLDGSGYPRGLKGDAIPVPARMMTISDIYDALTASDRPYKKAVPHDRAIDILASEVRRGKCDAELFRIFLDAEIWRIVLPR